VAFRDDGDHQVSVLRRPAAPAYLEGPTLDAALFLHYAAKVLHALGSGPAADELRQHISFSVLVLRLNKFEPFVSLVERQGECVGQLQMARDGRLSMDTTFRVSPGDTNSCLLDSTLLLLSHAAESHQAADDRQRLVDAVEALENYYRTIAKPGSFKALREAAPTALVRYRNSPP
jgi:hypothetical protein